ncbi:MAG: metal-dependent hydrolase [Saprospiraceae bacterium]|nr:metal-dependent hydrolase [Saprospiraceae bacterium]
MMFHRGPMHSLIFACIVPLILGPLVKKLYDKKWYQNKYWKWAGFGLGLLFFLMASTVIFLLAQLVAGTTPWLVVLSLVVVGIVFFALRFKQLQRQQDYFENVSSKIWIQLFFWAIFTHPLLDSLTTYGTQLFWPFSDYRVSISNISIVDPLYTIPFGLLLLVAAVIRPQNKLRSLIAISGLTLSSLYMLFTFINKSNIDEKFLNSLHEENIQVKEYMTVPTILNNVLWYGIAKTDTGYVCGYYSMFDSKRDFKPFQYIQANHNLLSPYQDQYLVQKLPWFSDGYYKVVQTIPGEFNYYDLRFGSTRGDIHDHESIIFRMKLVDHDGIINLEEEPRPENRKEDIEWFKQRIFGKTGQ